MSQFQASAALKSNHGVLLGGTAGFAVAGPFGALIGSAVGFGYDRYRRALSAVEEAYEAAMAAETMGANSSTLHSAASGAPYSAAQEAAFQIGIIALGAKLARLNRRLDRDTVEEFRTAFRLPPSDIPLIRKMFEQALFDSVGHKPYAEQLAGLFANRASALEQLLAGLVRFAGQEQGGLTPAVYDYLQNLTQTFNLPKGKLELILVEAGIKVVEAADSAANNTTNNTGAYTTIPLPKPKTAFDVLGVPKNAPEIVIKQAYRTLIKDCHPDRIISRDADPMVMAAANDRVASLNAAYAEIKRSRGWY